jgi:Mce-associated membrane protein
MKNLAVAVLAVAVLALGGAVYWVSGELREAQAAAQERRAVVEIAGAHAVNLLSVSHQSVDDDIRRVLLTSTGAAKQAWAAGAERLKRTTVADKVVQTAVLRSVGLVSMRGSTAEVLVVADVVIRWEGREEPPQERFYRWKMQVAKTGGAWLVAKEEQIL